MSIPRGAYRWPSDVLEWSESTGSVRLLLLVLAHYADERGVCWPSLDTLALDMNLSRRQVIDLVKEAEAMGELVKVKAGRGRGNSTRYRLAVGEKVRSTAPFVQSTAGAEKVRSSAIKGAVQRREKVRSTAPERPERSEQQSTRSATSSAAPRGLSSEQAAEQLREELRALSSTVRNNRLRSILPQRYSPEERDVLLGFIRPQLGNGSPWTEDQQAVIARRWGIADPRQPYQGVAS